MFGNLTQWTCDQGARTSLQLNAVAIAILLPARRRQIAGKIFFLTRLLPLLFDARSQLDLIRIVGTRCATRQENSADDRGEKQDGPHAGDHAIRQPDFNQKPSTVPRFRLQIRSGLLGAGYPTPFDTRARRTLGHVAGVGLPATATPAQKPQAQTSDQHKKRASVSLRCVEFGEDHWSERHFVFSEARRNF